MNYPEELRERYNEVMYDERDIIEKFLKDQYDIRYGRQRDTWHFEPAIKMSSHYGNIEYVTHISLDEGRFVVFFLEDGREYECFDFAYGELSKVIEALPDADEIIKRNAIVDIEEALKNKGNIAWFTGKKHIIGEGFDVLLISHKENETNVTLRKFEHDSTRLLESLSSEELAQLRDHINIDFLHKSDEYKELMELLSLQENLRFEFHNFGDAEFVIDKTDMNFNVSAVQRDDNGNLEIYGADVDADEDITLTEKEIKPQYLACIIECMKPKYTDIMNTYNGHNKELVRKINTAWKNEKYHNLFGDILFALGSRDKQEIQDKFDIVIDCNETAMDNAHEIMEHVCDDQDLETILSFIRYEE